VPDVETDPSVPPSTVPVARAIGYRSMISVPMLKDGAVVGTINVGRAEAGPFTDDEIAVLQTFADQAVIAIENVRLFTELQTRNQELTRALDTPPAPSDMLCVISRSQTVVQRVIGAIVGSAARLHGAYAGAVTLA